MAQRGSKYRVGSPKPFGFVPLPDRVHRSQPAGHDAYHDGRVSGKLRGRLRALTPVHVGSGGIELTERIDRALARQTPLVKAFVRSKGKRVIPGSSLKGAVRAVFEAITPSCVAKVGRGTQVPQEFRECSKLNRLCPACRVFGALGYLGQVRFSDAVQADDAVEIVEIPPLYRPRRRRGRSGRKFYQHGRPATGNTPLEVCPADSEFVFTLGFENLTASELGVLLIALGQGSPGLHLKLGGGKPVCYGSVSISVENHEIRDTAEAYLTLEAQTESRAIDSYIEAAQEEPGLLLQSQLNVLRHLLARSDERACPSGMY